eukprot:346159-Pelagomonas_calceolata.AAC.4
MRANLRMCVLFIKQVNLKFILGLQVGQPNDLAEGPPHCTKIGRTPNYSPGRTEADHPKKSPQLHLNRKEGENGLFGTPCAAFLHGLHFRKMPEVQNEVLVVKTRVHAEAKAS